MAVTEERPVDGTLEVVDPQILLLTEEVLSTQRAEIEERIQATDYESIVQTTQREQATQSAQETAAAIILMTAQAEELKENLVWKADLESGNLSQWDGKGDFLRQGSGMYSLITFAHQGNYAINLTIDTTAPTETGSHAAYLFYWQQLPEDAYYYSAWYYFPTQVHVQEWWTIMQWKSTYDGNTDHSVRVFSVGVQNTSDGARIILNQRLTPTENDGNNLTFTQGLYNIPINQWFQIEVYYKKGMDESGQIILWQDGQELFNLGHVTTVFSDGTIYWSVHNYSNGLTPNPVGIYVDDIAISKIRVGDRPLP